MVPGRGLEVVRAGTGTSPTAMLWGRAGIWACHWKDSDSGPGVCSRTKVTEGLEPRPAQKMQDNSGTRSQKGGVST